jgi:hypothetical protein
LTVLDVGPRFTFATRKAAEARVDELLADGYAAVRVVNMDACPSDALGWTRDVHRVDGVTVERLERTEHGAAWLVVGPRCACGRNPLRGAAADPDEDYCDECAADRYDAWVESRLGR